MATGEDKRPGRGGRPSQAQAQQIGERILDIATELFLTHGYGATSIETVAACAGISKRTFYHRFDNKAELFGAVVHRLIERLRPPNSGRLFSGGTLEEILLRLAGAILRAALSPSALALHRIVMAEAPRFPELAAVLGGAGARQEAIHHIAGLLEQEAETGRITLRSAPLAAEQFLHLVISAPQRRALLGMAMGQDELDAWVEQAVELFLHGYLARS